MAYGAEVDSGVHTYTASVTHNPTSSILTISVSGPSTEAQQDAVFQGALTKLAELANVTITSAVKTTYVTQQVTP